MHLFCVEITYLSPDDKKGVTDNISETKHETIYKTHPHLDFGRRYYMRMK